MSLFGQGHDLNRQFIARPDAAKEDMVFKWPDLTIRKFTQVTVQPDARPLPDSVTTSPPAASPNAGSTDTSVGWPPRPFETVG